MVKTKERTIVLGGGDIPTWKDEEEVWWGRRSSAVRL